MIYDLYLFLKHISNRNSHTLSLLCSRFSRVHIYSLLFVYFAPAILILQQREPTSRQLCGNISCCHGDGLLFSVTLETGDESRRQGARKTSRNTDPYPGKHQIIIRCCGDVGPASKTVGQHHPNIGLISRVFRVV